MMKINHEEINRVCGLTPETDRAIRGMWIEPGAILKVREVMDREGWVEPVIICDQNTYSLGDDLLENLENYDLICLDPEDLAADERSVSLARTKIPETADCMIALGSVTIHDITRYLCWEYGKPFLSVPTAASGEGYTTCISSVVRKGVKYNVMAVAPDYLFGDTDIFAAAPPRLTAAGFSDLIGNYIAMADWKISSVFTGEALNQTLCDGEKAAMEKVMAHLEALAQGDKDCCEDLLYALILPDMVMGIKEGARPMMGAEHHLSRYLDISVKQPRVNAVHGEKVGVMTLKCLKVYEDFKKALEEERLIPADARGVTGKEIRQGFLEAEVREAVTGLNRTNPLSGITGQTVLAHKEELLKILGELPSYAVIEKACRMMGCKMTAESLGIREDIIEDAMKYSPYVSPDITLLRLKKLFKND